MGVRTVQHVSRRIAQVQDNISTRTTAVAIQQAYSATATQNREVGHGHAIVLFRAHIPTRPSKNH